MKDYRKLTEDEVLQLKSQSCLADDWGNVLVAEGFNCEYVHHTRFSGEVKLGVFDADPAFINENIPAINKVDLW